MVRAVTFDAGGTLIEPWPSVGHVYAEVAGEFGFKCVPATLNARFAQTWRARASFNYSREEWFEVVRQSFEAECEVSPALFAAIYERFAERGCWLIYDDVIPALERASNAGLKLAVISNWDERLVPLLGKLGLASYFSRIVVSSALGVHKPDRRIFEQAARLLEVAPSEVLHIGDSQREDVQGARGAGLQALRIRRGGATESSDIERLTDALDRLSAAR
jgi:putative hydrolase of the HAD superfamily